MEVIMKLEDKVVLLSKTRKAIKFKRNIVWIPWFIIFLLITAVFAVEVVYFATNSSSGDEFEIFLAVIWAFHLATILITVLRFAYKRSKFDPRKNGAITFYAIFMFLLVPIGYLLVCIIDSIGGSSKFEFYFVYVPQYYFLDVVVPLLSAFALCVLVGSLALVARHKAHKLCVDYYGKAKPTRKDKMIVTYLEVLQADPKWLAKHKDQIAKEETPTSEANNEEASAPINNEAVADEPNPKNSDLPKEAYSGTYFVKNEQNIVDIIQDDENNDPIILQDNNGATHPFKAIARIPKYGKQYIVLSISDDLVNFFLLDEEKGENALTLIDNSQLLEDLYEDYQKMLKGETIVDKTYYQATKEGENEELVAKTRKTYFISTIILGVVYLFLAIIGILSVTHVMDGFWQTFYRKLDGVELEAAAFGLGWAYGFIFLSLIPTFAYFFAFSELYELKKRFRVLIFLGGVILSAALVAVFFLTYTVIGLEEYSGHTAYEALNLLDNSAWEQIMIIITAHVGMLLVYMFPLIRLNKQKMLQSMSFKKEQNKALSEEYDSEVRRGGFGWILVAFKKVFIWLWIITFYFILLIKMFYEKIPVIYYIVMTIIFTVLSAFVAVLCVILGGLILFCLIGTWFSGALSLYTPTTYSRYSYEIYDGGISRTLNYCRYSYTECADEFKDQFGNYWYSKDNGSTFYKK